uniref:SSD domain-containing protein n=1 Tax=Chromera velia CCMP2878 TaxID=1169474 RepID=A0A0G4I133_9ALVE|eukprot:Cvel_15.t1-p1 / transcript=Cvel_15.t1 / gene=Cvel_15 / organism=Chromera_velia_CCMP2878 / gene_product=hypothetical protein / transcript_product=hypothetical protein / location=Cvel_scaffold5:94793-100534(-) / protein_length=1308 / sequence_SO=supercontig / SO=protein_coding / is_pseudo=false
MLFRGFLHGQSRFHRCIEEWFFRRFSALAGLLFDFPLLGMVVPLFIFGALSVGILFRVHDFEWKHVWNSSEVPSIGNEEAFRDLFGERFRDAFFVVEAEEGGNLLSREMLKRLAEVDRDIQSFSVHLELKEEEVTDLGLLQQSGLSTTSSSSLSMSVSLSFSDLCAKRGDGKCRVLSPVDLYFDEGNFGDPFYVRWPSHFKLNNHRILVDVFPSVHLMAGGRGLRTREGPDAVTYLSSAPTLQFTYVLDDAHMGRQGRRESEHGPPSTSAPLGQMLTSAFIQRACDEWEREFSRRVFDWSLRLKGSEKRKEYTLDEDSNMPSAVASRDGNGEYTRIETMVPFTSLTENEEGPKATRVPLSITFAAAFSVLLVVLVLCVSRDMPSAKFLGGTMGVVAAGLGWLAGTGIANFAGLPWAGAQELVPFLVLGIGVDDCFVILNAYSLAGKKEAGDRDAEERGRQRVMTAVGESGLGITLTTVTAVLCLVVIVFSPFPALRYFGWNMIASLVVGYLCALTLFVSALGLEARREAHWESGYLRTCARLFLRSPFRPLKEEQLETAEGVGTPNLTCPSSAQILTPSGDGETGRQRERPPSSEPFGTSSCSQSGGACEKGGKVFVCRRAEGECAEGSSRPVSAEKEKDAAVSRNPSATCSEASPVLSVNAGELEAAETRAPCDFASALGSEGSCEGGGGWVSSAKKCGELEECGRGKETALCEGRKGLCEKKDRTTFNLTELTPQDRVALLLELEEVERPSRWAHLSRPPRFCPKFSRGKTSKDAGGSCRFRGESQGQEKKNRSRDDCGTSPIPPSRVELILSASCWTDAEMGEGKRKSEEKLREETLKGLREVVEEIPFQPLAWMRRGLRDWWGRLVTTSWGLLLTLTVYLSLMIAAALMLPNMAIGGDYDTSGDAGSHLRAVIDIRRRGFSWQRVDWIFYDLPASSSSSASDFVRHENDNEKGGQEAIAWDSDEVRGALSDVCRGMRESGDALLLVSPMCFFVNRVFVSAPVETAEGDGETEVKKHDRHRDQESFSAQLDRWLKSPIGRPFASEFIFVDNQDTPAVSGDAAVSPTSIPTLQTFRDSVLVAATTISSYDHLKQLQRLEKVATTSFFRPRFVQYWLIWLESLDVLVWDGILSSSIALVLVTVCVSLLVSPVAAILAAVGVASSLVLVCGGFTALGIALDQVVANVLILSSGLAIDYLAHTVASFSTARGRTRRHRGIESLVHIGSAVLAAALSSAACVCPLVVVREEYLYVGRAGTVLLLLFASTALHALWFLPALLCVSGPFMNRSTCPESEEGHAAHEKKRRSG